MQKRPLRLQTTALQRVSHLSGRGVGADVQDHVDLLGEVERLLGNRGSFMAPPHRHGPPQIHQNFDETGVLAAGPLRKTFQKRRKGSNLWFLITNNVFFFTFLCDF